jgi:hypothetical protein
MPSSIALKATEDAGEDRAGKDYSSPQKRQEQPLGCSCCSSAARLNLRLAMISDDYCSGPQAATQSSHEHGGGPPWKMYVIRYTTSSMSTAGATQLQFASPDADA